MDRSTATSVFLSAWTGLALVVCCAGQLSDSDDFTINLADATFQGSGCPAGSVVAETSADDKTIALLFSDYAVSTDQTNLRVRKSCNLALPVQVPYGKSLGIFKVGLSFLSLLFNSSLLVSWWC